MTGAEIVGWTLSVGAAAGVAIRAVWPAVKTLVEAAKDITGKKRPEDEPLRVVVETTARNLTYALSTLDDHGRRISDLERRRWNGLDRREGLDADPPSGTPDRRRKQ